MRQLIIGFCVAACMAQTREKTPSERLQSAAEVIRELTTSVDKGIPQALFEKARCVVVVPDLVKAAFLVGGQYGRGYASCREANGQWGPPAGIRIEGGSFGLQLGASATDLVMLVMNESGMRKLLQDKFVIGAEAMAAAGPVGRETSAATDALMKAEILTWSRSRGAFAGISLDGATIRSDTEENEKLYGRRLNSRDILLGDLQRPAAAKEFVAALNSAFQGNGTRARQR